MAVGPTDVVIALAVTVGGVGASPAFYDLMKPIADVADPFSALLLRLVVPSIFLGVIVSIGVSARRDI